MRLYFHPLPKLTFWSLLMLAALLSLGVWQIHRLHWKLNLIATANRNVVGPALPLDALVKMKPDDARYHRIALAGHFLNKDEAYLFTTGPNGHPVYHVLTPFILADGKAVIIDRGLIPLKLRNPATRPGGELKGMRHIVGVWRLPDSPGWFTPSPDFKTRVWYARDVTAMARHDGLTLAADAVVEADGTPNPGGWPKGGQTVVYFYNEHMQYAITWFALAAGLVVIYLAYHRSKGRLGLAK